VGKLIYIINARIPTEKAHGLQIMKMCEAFASGGADMELIIPKRINSIKQDPFEYYGVKRVFNIRKIFCVDLFRLKFVPEAISFYVQAFSFSKIAVLYALFKYGRPRHAELVSESPEIPKRACPERNRRVQDDNIFYSRDYITLFFLCLLGFNPVAEIHDYRSEKSRWWLCFIFKRARKIVVNSEGTFGAIREHYKLNSQKCLVAPNGVDADFFNIPESKEGARDQLKMPDDKIIIGYVGRLETIGREKGVSSLLRAFGKLADNRKDRLLYIIGGPNELVEKYKSELGEWGVSPKAVVFAGQVEYKKIPLYLRALDILVITVPDEARYAATTSPIKLFEFLAAGKAIIAPDLPNLRIILTKGNCLFFEPGNFHDLAEKIKLLIDNQPLREKLARQARADAKKYTWNRRAERIMKFIQA
jgi:glycosyltransferase involved in cell wall biosynthesis